MHLDLTEGCWEMTLNTTHLAGMHLDLTEGCWEMTLNTVALGFPAGSAVKTACQAGDVSSTPGSRRCPGEGNGTLQYSCVENPMARGAWRATVHEVAKELDTAQQLNNSHLWHCSPDTGYNSPRAERGHLISCRPQRGNNTVSWQPKKIMNLREIT